MFSISLSYLLICEIFSALLRKSAILPDESKVDIEGKDFSYNTNFSGPCAIVIGSEGRGISKLTLKKCDVLVKIPMVGKINSLNASVAGGIMMYEILKGRLSK